MILRIARLRNRNKLLKDVALTAGSDFLMLGIAIPTSTLLARLLGPNGRGELTAVTMWGTFIATLRTMGLHQALVFFAGKRINKPGYETASLVWACWTIMIPLSIGWTFIGYWFLPFLLRAQTNDVIHEARIFLLWVPTAVINSGVYALQGRRRFGAWNFFRLHNRVLYLGTLLVLWVTGNVSVPYLARSQLVLAAVGILVLIGLLRRNDVLALVRPNMATSLEMIPYGLRSLLGSMPELFNGRLDQILMAAFFVPAQLGLYAIAVTWSMMLGPLVKAIGEAIFPWIAVASNSSDAEQRFEKSVRMTVVTVSAASCTMLLLTPVAVPLIFGADYVPSVPAAMILVIASAVWQINFVMQKGLNGLGLPSGAAWSQGLGLMVTAGLLYSVLGNFGFQFAGWQRKSFPESLEQVL